MQEEWEGIHTHGVWLGKSSSWAEDLLAVRRRVFMGLEEGFRKTAGKGGGEIRIGFLHKQGFQEGKAGNLHRGKHTEPFLLLHQEELQPAMELGERDGESFAKPLHSGKAKEILCQDAKDEEQAIARVRDDEIREDSMGMAAGTDEAQDAEAVPDRGTINEIHQGTAIVGMDAAGAFCPAAWAGLEFWPEPIHERLEQFF